MVWVDTWQTGTEILVSEGPYAEGEARIVVATTYAESAGSEPWRWRSELERRDEALEVRHYDVSPAGAEAIAVEFVYTPA